LNFIYLVIVLVLFQYIYFSISVGNARGKYNIKAPAISGNEHFERYYRVQMNTLELLICFIPALLISAQFWSPVIMSAIGFIFFIGRFIYFKSYVSDPASRTVGFALSMLPTMVLLLSILVGVIKGFL